MNIREIKFNDYKKISELVYSNNLHIYNYKYWQDLWLLNPYYKNINNKWVKGWVLEHKNQIVGFLGNFPMVYSFLGKDYIVAVATCWVTGKEYRNYSLLLMKAYFNQKNIDLFLSSTANETASAVFKAFQGNNINFKEYKENLLFIFNYYNIIKNFKIAKKIKFIFFLIKPIIIFFKIIINFFYSAMTMDLDNNIKIYKSFNHEFDFLWNNIKKK